MDLIKFLLRTSSLMLISAALVGMLSGASRTGLIAIINQVISGGVIAPASLALQFVVVALVVVCGDIASNILLVRLGQGAVFDLRRRLCRLIVDTPLRKLEEHGTHRLWASLTDDIPVLAGVLSLLRDVCINTAVVAGCLFYLAWLSLPVFGAVLVFIVVGAVSYQFLTARAIRIFRKAREERDVMYKHLRALTDGTKELKLHQGRRNAFFKDLLDTSARTLLRFNLQAMARNAVAAGWGQLLTYGLIGFLLLALPRMIALNAEVLVGYVLIILYMVAPLNVLLSVFPAMGRANIALQKVESLGLKLKESAVEDIVPTEPEAAWQQLELKGVVHTYYRENENENFTLGPIDLTLKPGELVFLTGGNGRGKTTLAKLLTGLYAPEKGEMFFNGQLINNENREHFRQHFSVVFSDFYLFDELLGLKGPGFEERAREYLARLELDRKVSLNGTKLSTTQLSNGQRKRLALLTAYLEDRPIYVFDEWAADQDPVFKKVFYHQLLPELIASGKTAVVISHVDHYYETADRLVKLDYGLIESDQKVSKSRPNGS
ncbi:MAG: cyclic peptide export ABC transporter [Acidobacteriota bacterium]